MIVLDASAVMALLYKEPGADEVASRLDGTVMSAVNLAEVLQKSAAQGIDPEAVRTLLGEAEIGIVGFDDRMAVETAALWPLTRHKGLSLADRACLALAQALNGVAVTADRAWAGLDLPDVAIHVIRR